jgi:Cdc6-like AAA superfamily ATPase
MDEKDVGYTRLYQSIKHLVDNNVEKQSVSGVSAITALSASVETDFQTDIQQAQFGVHEMEWILKSPEFENWLSSHEPQFLWYSGLPGSGKTTTSLHIVQQIKQMHTSFRTRLAFFFCKIQKKPSSTIVVASIISQLLDSDTIDCIPPNLRTSLSLSDQSTERKHEATLWQILEKMLRTLLESTERLEIRVILDGIDELHSEDLDRFLSNLREVWDNIKGRNNAKNASRFKILAVSRPYPNISELLKGLPYINPEKESTGKYYGLSPYPTPPKEK